MYLPNPNLPNPNGDHILYYNDFIRCNIIILYYNDFIIGNIIMMSRDINNDITICNIIKYNNDTIIMMSHTLL